MTTLLLLEIYWLRGTRSFIVALTALFGIAAAAHLVLALRGRPVNRFTMRASAVLALAFGIYLLSTPAGGA